MPGEVQPANRIAPQPAVPAAHRLLHWLLYLPNKWRRGGLLSYWVLIFLLTHWPDVDDFVEVGWLPDRFDLCVHFCFYFGWTVLWWWVLAGRATPLSLRGAMWLLAGAAAYSTFDEVSQALDGRDPAVSDFVADMTGAFCALFVMCTWHRRLLAAPITRARLAESLKPQHGGSTR